MEPPKHRFFAHPACFLDGAVRLPDDEARHAVRVLRLSTGDEITVVDGSGGTHVVRLEETGRGRVTGRVLRTERDIGESARRLSIGLALLKNRNRYETFLEKAVELGADRIVPLETTRTERRTLRPDRAEAILISALKQSGRSRLPELADICSLGDAAAALSSEAHKSDTTRVGSAGSWGAARVDPVRLIAHEAAPGAEHILNVSLGIGDVHILVGPEGGFSEDEVQVAVNADFKPVWMGPRRLRAETAALAAAGVLRMRMDQEG